MARYELYGPETTVEGHVVRRIRVTNAFSDFEKGQIGGYVESEANLSQDENDTAWIHDDSIVCGNGIVQNHSRIEKHSFVVDSQIDNGSCIHNSRVEESKIDDRSEVSNESTVKQSNVVFSHIAHNSIVEQSDLDSSFVIRDSVVEQSRLETSEVEESQVYKSKMINHSVAKSGAAVINGTTLDNVKVTGIVVIHKHLVELQKDQIKMVLDKCDPEMKETVQEKRDAAVELVENILTSGGWENNRNSSFAIGEINAYDKVLDGTYLTDDGKLDNAKIQQQRDVLNKSKEQIIGPSYRFVDGVLHGLDQIQELYLKIGLDNTQPDVVEREAATPDLTLTDEDLNFVKASDELSQ